MLVSDSSKATEIVNALSDEYSRKIFFSTIERGLTAEEISNEQSIPISTCYRKIHELLQCGIVRVEETIVDDFGKKFLSYKACFKKVTITLECRDLIVDIVPNNHSYDKLHAMWSSLRKGNRSEESVVSSEEQGEEYLTH